MLLLQTLHRLQVGAELRHRGDRTFLTNPRHLIVDVAEERVQQQRILEILVTYVTRLRQRSKPVNDHAANHDSMPKLVS